ncbi:hypothetical protein [Candidatus Spyradosoma sp. SGI.093]|uniref:hypothetical protein n=1 Tax=Candidatus Spyradosoma sp. SGI.093 TaxID=3420583 RepID=UPI003D093567
MAKVDLDILQLVLTRNKVDARMTAKIISEIQEEIKLEQLENKENKVPAAKKKFVFVACDPEGALDGVELTGYVVQIPEEDSEFTATEKIIVAAYEYNRTRKGRRNPVKSISEACEFVPAKFFKDQNVWVKNKEAAFLLPTDNVIPTETKEKPFE